MVCLSRPYPFKSFKGCLPQILLGPLLNTLSHMSLDSEIAKFITVGANEIQCLLNFGLDLVFKSM